MKSIAHELARANLPSPVTSAISMTQFYALAFMET